MLHTLNALKVYKYLSGDCVFISGREDNRQALQEPQAPQIPLCPGQVLS